MAKSRYHYEENDPEVATKHAENRGGYDNPVKDSFKAFMPKEGKHRIRIIGRTWSEEEGPKHWAFPMYLHYEVGPDNAAYPCLEKHGKGRCPICEERKALDAAGDEEGAKAMRASLTQLAWVIDRNAEEDGPKVFRMPASKLEAIICRRSRDEDTGASLRIDHPENGRDVIFYVKGAKRTKQYEDIQLASKTSPLCEEERDMEDWLAFVKKNPLPSVINFFDAKHIEKVFSGTKDRNDEDDGDRRPARGAERSERPARSDDGDEERGKRTARKDDDDEPPPRSRRATTRADDDIDAPEEEAPRASRKRAELNDEEERPAKGKERGEDREPSRGRERTEERSSRGDDEERPARRGLRDEVKSGLSRRKRDEDDE